MEATDLTKEIRKASFEWAKDGLETNYTTNIAGATLEEVLSDLVRDKNSHYEFKYFTSGNYGFNRTLEVRKYHRFSNETLATYNVELNFMNEYGEVGKTPKVSFLL